MANKGKVTALDSTSTQKGVSRIATQQEVDSGTLDNVIVTPLTLAKKPIPSSKFSGFAYKKFNSFIQMEPNTIYISIDPTINPPAEAKLPSRGTGKAGDIIIVYNIANTTSFKVTLNNDLILHYDGQVIEDIDNKYLLGDKGGSCVILSCGGSQQWEALFHYQISVSSSF